MAKKRPTFWVVREKTLALAVVGIRGGLFQGYRPVEGWLPDEEREEPGQESGQEPGGQAAAQVGRDHALI